MGGRCRPQFLAEQTAQQRDQGNADQGNAAASHQLLHALTFCGGIIAAVAFHEVDSTPHAQTGTQSNDQSLQNVHCTIEKYLSHKEKIRPDDQFVLVDVDSLPPA